MNKHQAKNTSFANAKITLCVLFLYLPKFYFLHFCKYTPKIATNGILAGKNLTSSGASPKEPDLDPVFIACYCFCGGLAFSRFSAVLSEQRKCFCPLL